MERRIVNPWSWQDRLGFVQGHEVRAAARTLYCSGIASVDENGTPLHAGDMGAQLLAALDNLETLLSSAGYALADVVRITTYVTDAGAYFAARPPLQERLEQAGCRYTSTLLVVAGLARPELVVELEATAAA